MGVGAFSSDSRSKANVQTITTADNSPVSAQRYRGKTNIGGIAVEKGAQVGGFDFGNIGKGATVNITSPADNSSANALNGLQDAVTRQSQIASDTLSGLASNLGTPREGLSTAELAIAASAVGAIALVALAIVFHK